MSTSTKPTTTTTASKTSTTTKTDTSLSKTGTTSGSTTVTKALTFEEQMKALEAEMAQVEKETKEIIAKGDTRAAENKIKDWHNVDYSVLLEEEKDKRAKVKEEMILLKPMRDQNEKLEYDNYMNA